MHSERWAGQFHIANVLSLLLFLASKGRLEEVEERAESERGKWGRGRRNWNRNPSQWIKKQDSSFYRVYFPPAIALSVCLPAPQRPRHDWYALRAKLATETQKIMHKRWTQFIVFSRGPRGKPKLWIYASDPWDRCWGGGRRCKSSCRTDADHLLTSGATRRGRREAAGPAQLPQLQSLRWKLAS